MYLHLIGFLFFTIFFDARASVYEFGYSALGEGVQHYSNAFEKTNFSDKFQLIDKNAHKYMPLYLDLQKDPRLAVLKNSFLGSSETLIYLRKSNGVELSLSLFDIHNGKIKRDIPVAKGFLASMPTFDPKTFTVYFLVHSVGRKLLLKLYGYELLTGKTHSADIDLGKIYKKQYPATSLGDLERLIGCKTALKLFEGKSNGKIIFGCSIPADYGKYRGVRGIIVAADVTKSGEIIFQGIDKKNYFFPSKITTNNFTGFNTGIYHAGGGASFIYPDNLYILTGNGPSFPDEENFGCAILRLDLENLSVKESLLFDNKNFHECFSNNLDYSTSSPAIAGQRNNYLGVAVNSAGYMQIFDPLYLKESKKNYPGFFVGSDDSYGQANIVALGAGKFQIIVQGHTKTTYDHRDNFVLASEDEKQFLNSEGYRQDLCVGHMPPEESNHFSLYYSGKYKGNYVLLKDDSPISKEVVGFIPKLLKQGLESVTGDYMSPYLKLKNFKKASSKNQSEVTQNFIKVPIVAYYAGRFINWVNGMETKYDSKLVGHLKTNGVKFDIGYLLQSPGKKFCSDKITGYPKFYIYKKIENGALKKDNQWNVSSFVFDKKSKSLTKIWEFAGPQNTSYPHSHMATAFFLKDKKGFTVVPVSSKEAAASDVFILNSSTGKLISKIRIPGEVHFSMPLITRQNIYIATKENGIFSIPVIAP